MRVFLLIFSVFYFVQSQAQSKKIYLNAGIVHASLNFEQVILNYGKNNTANFRIGVGTYQYAAIKGGGLSLGLVQNFSFKKHSIEMGFGSNIIFNGVDKKAPDLPRRLTILPQFNAGYKYHLVKSVNIKGGIGVPEYIYLGIEYLF